MERLEEGLLEPLNVAELARMVGLGPFHFQTVFSCMAGVTLSEYVRRRKMCRAAADLQDSMRVIDAALKSDPPLHFQITIQGAEEMEYRILPMEAFSMLVQSREYDVDE